MSLAGSFLIAKPVLRDPNFHQTVVLLLAHGPEGALGVVVNRPAKAEGAPFPLFVGGPCPAPGLILLHGHADWIEPGTAAQEPAPGIFLGDPAVLELAGKLLPDESVRLRGYHGYAGWGAGQLEGELAEGAWAVTAASADLLFGTPAADLWRDLKPPALPQPSLN